MGTSAEVMHTHKVSAGPPFGVKRTAARRAKDDGAAEVIAAEEVVKPRLSRVQARVALAEARPVMNVSRWILPEASDDEHPLVKRLRGVARDHCGADLAQVGAGHSNYGAQ